MISKSNQALYQIYRNKDAIQSVAEKKQKKTYRKTNDSSVPKLQRGADSELQGEQKLSWNNTKEKIVFERDVGNWDRKKAVV